MRAAAVANYFVGNSLTKKARVVRNDGPETREKSIEFA